RHILGELDRLRAALGALQCPESVRDQRRDDDEDDHQHRSIARHQPEHDGKPADELNASADCREHRRDVSGYAIPCQTRRERVESHEFLEAALNEDATDQDASEQADGLVPCGGEPVRSRADPNQPRLWDRPELAGVRRSSRAPPFRPTANASNFVRIARASLCGVGIMIRIVAVCTSAALLAACSGSDRVEGIVPAWVNTPPPPAVQYSVRRTHVEAGAAHNSVPAANPAPEPQREAKKPEPQSSPEE